MQECFENLYCLLCPMRGFPDEQVDGMSNERAIPAVMG